MNKIIGNFELTFEGKNISYTLSALYDVEKNEYRMPSLSFIENEGALDEKSIEFWDGEIFLTETLYKKVLVPWVVERKIEDAEEFAALIRVNGVSIDDLEGLCKLLEEGFRLKLLKDKE
jgi:hypothetical protein